MNEPLEHIEANPGGESKASLRSRLAFWRDALSAADIETRSGAATANLLVHPRWADAARIMVYVSFRSEAAPAI